MSRDRSWAGATGRYGAAGESGAWKIVFDNYYWDRLREAYEYAKELGAGNWGHGLVGFRAVEGEFLTRERGTIRDVNEWLKIETIDEEVGSGASVHPLPNPPPGARELPAILVETIVDSCDAVARRFGFEHGPPVMVSVLAEESNVPWMPGRHGYCVDKFPYDKICIPNYSLRDHDDLEHVIQHEYAHVVTLNLSQGRVPHWLDEAVAMVAGGGVDRRAWRMLAEGRDAWMDPVTLDRAYSRDREDEGQRNEVWMAYQQSAVIGFYLASLKGDAGLGEMLRAFSDNSLLQDLVMRVKGESAAGEALRQVFGFGESDAFALAREWLGERR